MFSITLKEPILYNNNQYIKSLKLAKPITSNRSESFLLNDSRYITVEEAKKIIHTFLISSLDETLDYDWFEVKSLAIDNGSPIIYEEINAEVLYVSSDLRCYFTSELNLCLQEFFFDSDKPNIKTILKEFTYV